MQTVKTRNSLAQHEFIFGLQSKLACRIKEVENYLKLRLNPEMTRFVAECAIAEKALLKKALQERIDIPSIVIAVLSDVFSLNDAEKEQLSAQLEFLADNKLVRAKSASFLKSASDALASICKGSSTSST